MGEHAARELAVSLLSRRAATRPGQSGQARFDVGTNLSVLDRTIRASLEDPDSDASKVARLNGPQLDVHLSLLADAFLSPQERERLYRRVEELRRGDLPSQHSLALRKAFKDVAPVVRERLEEQCRTIAKIRARESGVRLEPDIETSADDRMVKIGRPAGLVYWRVTYREAS